MTTLRKSVPTAGVSRWWDCGWMYVMPDFDNKDHSIIEWRGDTEPEYPAEHRVPSTQTQDAENERTASGR